MFEKSAAAFDGRFFYETSAVVNPAKSPAKGKDVCLWKYTSNERAEGGEEMNIAQVEAFPLCLPMKRDFAISGGKVGDRAKGAPHVYVRITDEEGYTGWGEARPSHRWSEETLETVVTTVRNYLAPALAGQEVEDVKGASRQMQGEIRGGMTLGQPIAKAAVDTALHDLIGKRRGQSLAQMWLGRPCFTIPLSYLISTRSPEEAARLARQAKEEGYRGVDVKIGSDPRRDVEIVEAVQGEAGGLFFRVDANQGYTLSQARYVVRELVRLGVDVLEQPLAAHDWTGHAALRRQADLPIALDESVWTAGHVMQAIRLEACDMVVIKLTKMGGLQEAKRCGEIAAAAGLQLLGGGLTESSIGLAASAHLFHELGIDTPVDLNGPFFLAEDPVREPIILQNGEALLPAGPGHGCTVEMKELEKLAWSGDRT
jgi:L-Ala-D/L-Glu epimerase